MSIELAGESALIRYVVFLHRSNLPVIQATAVTNTLVVPSPMVTVTTGSSTTSQKPQMGADMATPGLFANRTDDSDDDYDV